MRLETGLIVPRVRTFMTFHEKHSTSFPESLIPSTGNEVQEEQYESGILSLHRPQ